MQHKYNLTLNHSQTAGDYDDYVKYQLLNNAKYSNFTFTNDHPFGFDALWSIALSLNKSIDTMKTSIFRDGRMRRLEDYSYDDEEMTKVFVDSLAHVAFIGVTVSLRISFLFFLISKVLYCITYAN